MQTGEPIVDLLTPPISSPPPFATHRWVTTHKVPLRDVDGQIIGLVGFNQDITERKSNEVERELLISELESRNAEMERFTYTVSHDLRSPIITIKGFIGLLEVDITKQDANRIESDLGFIRTAAEQMENLLNDLLELSRIGRIVNPDVTMRLTELAADAVRLVTGQIMQREVSVTVQPDMPVIKGDRARLLEVFQNLLENAVKYMGTQSQPHIEIGAEQRADDVLCYVRDNGIGIAPDYHETIFELFDQLDPDIEGTGIGLALVRRIIEYHNGTIWVESDGPGTGSTFYFTLPLPT
jgi:signal transduction histidine kinase